MKHRVILLSFALAVACSGTDPRQSQGIDLSHHNGAIDWRALESAPIEFIYLKATEGTDWKDTSFQNNWLAAHARGYETGAYHFYLLCYGGAAQAANFIQSVEVRSDSLPPAVDLEYHGNCTPNGPPEEVYTELSIFMSALEDEYGTPPAIYTTQRFYNDWIAGRFARSPIWIRALGETPPALPDGRDWWIWQYSASGHISGIDSEVDLNLRRE